MTAVRTKLSSHQVGVADLLDALRWTEKLPRRLVLLGMVPRTDELGLGLTPEVDAGIDDLVRAVAAEVQGMGYPIRRRADDEEAPAGLDDPAVRALDP